MTDEVGGGDAVAAAWQSRASEQQLAPAVRATLQRNQALEPLDVVTFNDGTGDLQTRIAELHLTWCPQEGRHAPVLVGEGVQPRHGLRFAAEVTWAEPWACMSMHVPNGGCGRTWARDMLG